MLRSRTLKFTIPATAALISTTLLSACWVKKTTCRGLHNQMPNACSEYTNDDRDGAAETSVASGTQPDGSGNMPSAPIITETSKASGPGFNLTRSAPEQLSNNIVAAVNYGDAPDELRWADEYSGQTHDYIQLLFGVALGGVDFETASIRDPSTKAQTLLVSRVVAMQLANAALWKDWEKSPSARIVFNKCDMATDRPFRASDQELPPQLQNAVKEGEVRWLAQVEELFFRFYSRPPTTADIEAIKTAFLTGMDAEGYPLAGWQPVLYAMLASQEFWHQ